MITFGKSYIVDGKAYATLREAKQDALVRLLTNRLGGSSIGPAERDKLVEYLVDESDAIVNILTTKETSLPKARKANGGTKRRPPTTKPLVETP